jgi:uncharacterized protein YecE (DUF72 family)
VPPHPAGTIRIGISGWRYASWRGRFYPKGLAQRRELEHASSVFDSLEINGSFYSLQRPEHYQRWRAETPRDFVFSIKGSRYVTHFLKLKRIEPALANFFASGVASLREKLGPFLWQLPPNLAFDPGRIDAFLSLLPRDARSAAALARRHDERVEGRTQTAFGTNRPLRHALEVRHPSFVVPEFIALLRRHGVAFVVADTGGKWPEFEDVTADFVYVRLHGPGKLYASDYSDAALARWAARVRRWSEGGAVRDARCISRDPVPRAAARDVYCYFDNTDKLHAPGDALDLMRLLRIRASKANQPRGADASRRKRRASAP